MSRGGRPSARGAHKRDLVGPREILERIQEKGGIPDDVMNDLKRPKPRNPRTEAANEAVIAAIQGASELLSGRGVEHTVVEPRGSDKPAEAMAWIMSVTNSMKESVPRKKWCRHMRAVDPRLSEIRTVAILSAGIWLCVECLRELGDAPRPNPWPDECDLCGAKMQPGGFNEIAFNIPGCFVNCTVCNECASYMQQRAA